MTSHIYVIISKEILDCSKILNPVRFLPGSLGTFQRIFATFMFVAHMCLCSDLCLVLSSFLNVSIYMFQHEVMLSWVSEPCCLLSSCSELNFLKTRFCLYDYELFCLIILAWVSPENSVNLENLNVLLWSQFSDNH